MGSCTAYDENCVNWKFENLLESKLCLCVVAICVHCSGMFWSVELGRVVGVCAWTDFGVCISRSSEPGSPRREWQKGYPCVTRSSRAGEGVLSWATGHLA